jgi:hypothetical protein
MTWPYKCTKALRKTAFTYDFKLRGFPKNAEQRPQASSRKIKLFELNQQSFYTCVPEQILDLMTTRR